VSGAGNENYLIILRDEYGAEGLEFVRSALKKIEQGKPIVGVIDEVEEPPQELKELCHENGCELVRFHGLFELHYFLQRLNSKNSSWSIIWHAAEPVRVGSHSYFEKHASQILITHSYVPSDPSSSFAAARDVWELIGRMPDLARAKIHPAIECATLPHVLDESKPLLAWIHIGHGKGNDGLQQSGGSFKKPDEWLKCFANYKSSLALAVFSSCHSQVIARRFAEAGVGVTIGFANNVPQKVSVLLTREVVAAALRSNGNREEILRAFHNGREFLMKEYPAAEAISFWAEH
jgi:hypothetical protein